MTQTVTATGAPLPRDTSRFYYPQLDALRFGAFLLVFCTHGLPQYEALAAAGVPAGIGGALTALKVGGRFGLDLFFFLSSYLITELLLREHSRCGSIDVKAFWIRRILRIWPLYFVFLAAATWIVPMVLHQSFPRFHLAAFSVFLANVAIAVRPWGIQSVAFILWSVSMEEQFYLLWPLTLSRFMAHLRTIAFSLILISVVARAFVVAVGAAADDRWLWTNPITRLDPIAAGALMASLLAGRRPQVPPAMRWAMMATALAAFVVCGYAPQEGPWVLLTYPAATLASGVLVVAALACESPWRWTVYLGRISYGLYVFHLLALSLAWNYLAAPGPALMPMALQFSAALALTVVFAAVSYRWLETPFLRLKVRFSR